jgi:hypothetical protein
VIQKTWITLDQKRLHQGHHDGLIGAAFREMDGVDGQAYDRGYIRAGNRA